MFKLIVIKITALRNRQTSQSYAKIQCGPF